MKILRIGIVLLLFAAGCAAPTVTIALPSPTGTTSLPTATIASASATPALASTSAPPTVARAPTSPATPTATGASLSTPVTLPSPTTAPAATAESSVQNATPGPNWKTYSNPTWHVALEYPPDWTVKTDASGVTFAGPDGSSIHLAQAAGASKNPGGLEPSDDLPNTRCSLRTNPHGVPARICLDTIARSYNAQMLVTFSGGSTLVMLTAGIRTDVQVLYAMVASARPAP